MKIKVLSKLIIVAIALLAAMACESDIPANNPGYNDGVERPYVIASQGTFSNTTTNVLLTTSPL